VCGRWYVVFGVLWRRDERGWQWEWLMVVGFSEEGLFGRGFFRVPLWSGFGEFLV